MEYDKTFAQEPFGIDKIPEFQVRPNDFFQHFFFPVSAELTVGEYSEPTTNCDVARRRRFGARPGP